MTHKSTKTNGRIQTISTEVFMAANIHIVHINNNVSEKCNASIFRQFTP